MEKVKYNILTAISRAGICPCFEIMKQIECDPTITWLIMSELAREQLVKMEPGNEVIPFSRIWVTNRGMMTLFAEQQERARKEDEQLRSNQARHKRAKKSTQHGDHKITDKPPVIPHILHVLLVILVSFFVGALATFLMNCLTLGH